MSKRESKREQKIDELKKYFEKRDDVVMAFLFGSRARGEARATSDWDIAVYFTPEEGRIEWEATERGYTEEDTVWGEVISLLGTDSVDLVVLNRAPASIAETALRGKKLVIKDKPLWMKFTRVVTSSAEEYRQFVDDFYAISERSRSLSERDREDLLRTINFMEEQVQLYEIYRAFTQREFEAEPRKRNEIERWLENIVNAIIDVSKVVLANRKRLIPPTYGETVGRAVRELELPDDFAEKFERWVRLRNVLAHEYLDIKWKRLDMFVEESEPYIKTFVQTTKKYLEESGGST